MQTIQCRDSEVLCLSIDWSKRMDKRCENVMILCLGKAHKKDISSENRSLIVSCSDGNLCLVQHQEGKYATTQSWHAHDYEPWIAAWNYTETSVLYSGNHEILAMTCGLIIYSIRRRRSKAKGLGYSSRI